MAPPSLNFLSASIRTLVKKVEMLEAIVNRDACPADGTAQCAEHSATKVCLYDALFQKPRLVDELRAHMLGAKRHLEHDVPVFENKVSFPAVPDNDDIAEAMPSSDKSSKPMPNDDGEQHEYGDIETNAIDVETSDLAPQEAQISAESFRDWIDEVVFKILNHDDIYNHNMKEYLARKENFEIELKKIEVYSEQEGLSKPARGSMFSRLRNERAAARAVGLIPGKGNEEYDEPLWIKKMRKGKGKGKGKQELDTGKDKLVDELCTTLRSFTWKRYVFQSWKRDEECVEDEDVEVERRHEIVELGREVFNVLNHDDVFDDNVNEFYQRKNMYLADVLAVGDFMNFYDSLEDNDDEGDESDDNLNMGLEMMEKFIREEIAELGPETFQLLNQDGVFERDSEEYSRRKNLYLADKGKGKGQGKGKRNKEKSKGKRRNG